MNIVNEFSKIFKELEESENHVYKNKILIEKKYLPKPAPYNKYQRSLNILKNHGFNPIAATTIYCEDIFCFRTEKEATKAFKKFENKVNNEHENISGYWYGKRSFLKLVKEYEEDRTEKDGREFKLRIKWT